MSRSCRWPLLALAVLVLPLGAAPAPPPAAEDPDREDRLEQGRLAFRDNCLMCHAEEMTSRSRLTEKQWATEVDKMIGWGAPVPVELKGPLLDYLIDAFSDPTKSPVPPPQRMTFRAALATIRPEGPPPAGDAARGGALYAQHCATCHGPEARGADLGTCLVEHPVLLRPADYSAVVRDGRRRMPGFAALLKPEQAADILGWLRTQRYNP
jgi:mono/diheme cytochrome c family protein